ncbi:hypothetical protein ACQHIV_28195 [Kribbella sp. GL6]|uniref:hypothetical protein n=1 Tax=Kribbella sp. GL6 TaxID=3419765 RepID=UPI003CFDBF9D
MQYDEFRTAYDPVFDVLDAKTLPDWLPGAVARLKELARWRRRSRTPPHRGVRHRGCRGQAGMTAIGELAEANPGDKSAMLDLNESLYMRVLSLQSGHT